MDTAVFTKMRVKAGANGVVMHPPPDYPADVPFNLVADGSADFVHLFVTSRAEIAERFDDAACRVGDTGLFWVSYPKSTSKQRYDINRDSLWSLVLPRGWHPVAQVWMDDRWSAIRLVRNVPGTTYDPPSNVKTSASQT